MRKDYGNVLTPNSVLLTLSLGVAYGLGYPLQVLVSLRCTVGFTLLSLTQKRNSLHLHTHQQLHNRHNRRHVACGVGGRGSYAGRNINAQVAVNGVRMNKLGINVSLYNLHSPKAY
jgi:hypothetical protein